MGTYYWIVLEAATKSAKQETSQKLEEGEYLDYLNKNLVVLLSPMEIETIGMWFDQDQHSPEIIKASVKRSCVSRKSIAYVILIVFYLNGKRKILKQLNKSKSKHEQFRQHTITPSSNTS